MSVPSSQAAQAGKYLTFKLGDELYGIEILAIQEIIQMMNVTHLPHTPGYIRGVINLRGRIIPVLDLRKKFTLEPRPDTDRTCIIVARISKQGSKMTMGIVVDEVAEAVDIRADQIQETPDFGVQIDSGYIRGIGSVDKKAAILLNVDHILTTRELEAVSKAAERHDDGKDQ